MFNIPNEIPEELKFDIKSIAEEKFNFYSHLLSFITAIFASVSILIFLLITGQTNKFLPILIYCGTLMLTYFSSTNYHSKYTLRARQKARTIDHISIYFLIAGSYTPFLMIFINNQKSTIILCVLWLMVLIGSIFKYFFTHKFKLVSTLAYLVMGWMAVFIYQDLANNLTPLAFLFIKIGGAFYTIGTIFYLWKKLYQNHFIWHLFVCAGSLAHFLAVFASIV